MKCTLIGIGGAGRNHLNTIIESGYDATNTVYMDTDTNSLFASKSKEFVQLGKSIFKGLGTGGHPHGGLVAAQFTEGEILEAIKGYDVLVLCAGLGGGVGSGATPYIVSLIESYTDAKAFVIATMPARIETKRRKDQAKEAKDFLLDLSGENLYVIDTPNIAISKMYEEADKLVLAQFELLADKYNFT